MVELEANLTRDEENNEESDSKRSRPEKNVELRLLIPQSYTGTIIGRGGAKIQKLRSDNNVSVRLPERPGPERVLMIETESDSTAENVINTVEQILKYVQEENESRTSKIPSGDLRMLLHYSLVGPLIGPGGAKIKELRNTCGANIRIFPKRAPQSTDRCISLVGDVEAITSSLKTIMKVIENEEIKGASKPYDPTTFDIESAKQYGGYGSEKGLLKSMGLSTDLALGWKAGKFNALPGQNMFGMGFGMGSRDLGIPFNNSFGSPTNTNFPSLPFSSGSNLNMQDTKFPSLALSSPGSNLNMQTHGNVVGPLERETLKIPNDAVGAVIGTSGSRISMIRMQCNADIKIPNAANQGEDRLVEISGTKQSIQMAKEMIEVCVRSAK